MSFINAQVDNLTSSYSVVEHNESSVPQYVMYDRRRKVNHHNIYLEALGSGGFGSINHEWGFLRKSSWQLLLRSGFSFVPIDSNNGAVLIFPIMVHAVYGSGSHKLDVGIGQTFSVTTRGDFFLRAPVSVGYRLNPRNSRMFYRIAYTPIISYLIDQQLEHWGGVSIGLKLK